MMEPHGISNQRIKVFWIFEYLINRNFDWNKKGEKKVKKVQFWTTKKTALDLRMILDEQFYTEDDTTFLTNF